MASFEKGRKPWNKSASLDPLFMLDADGNRHAEPDFAMPSANSQLTVFIIRVLNFGHSPRPYLCGTLIKRLRFFPVQRVDILGSGVAHQ